MSSFSCSIYLYGGNMLLQKITTSALCFSFSQFWIQCITSNPQLMHITQIVYRNWRDASEVTKMARRAFWKVFNSAKILRSEVFFWSNVFESSGRKGWGLPKYTRTGLSIVIFSHDIFGSVEAYLDKNKQTKTKKTVGHSQSWIGLPRAQTITL